MKIQVPQRVTLAILVNSLASGCFWGFSGKKA